ncbi:MAG: deoxyribonuclease, partial [Chloroflexota bacterium]|nr:deoxyribonuclease [Chloroflexota bacterium]
VGPPQRWFGPNHSDDTLDAYNRLASEFGIGPNVVHALYLVNLASPDPTQRQRSVAALIHQMHQCERIGALGLVVHVGSRKGLDDPSQALDMVAEGVGEILARSATTKFLIENTAGMGASIGSDFADIGGIIERLGGDERLGVCLDTAHTFEAGHDYRTRDGLDRMLDEFDHAVGLERLSAVHANDSKTAFGSNVDRHENIGRGRIGDETLGYFMTHPAMAELPFYLEVPGLLGRGPDRENVAALRRLAGLPPLPEPEDSLAEELESAAAEDLP